LELALLDFGSEHSFKMAAQKIQRHYGVEISESTTRFDVYKHAEIMQAADYALSGKQAPEALIIINQTDGGMIPIVSQKNPLFIGDRRKNRLREWREIRLTVSRKKGSVNPIYSAKIGTPDEIGNMIKATVNRVGRGEKTKIHCLGDGAPWIAEQVEDKFGADASYLLDFYHASEYLAKAAICCHPDNHKQWFKIQQNNLKNNNTSTLFYELTSHAEQCSLKTECPALTCYNYLIKRTKQLDYKSAIEAGLPIGSGEVEGGIRSVIQKRLKISGVSWKLENAQKIACLRTVVANNRLDAYGQDLRSGAFKSFS
jgi:hypothetical protein